MNKGLLAILAAAALATTKNVSSGTGSFGKKRNKSLERFDRNVQTILTNLGAKEAGVSLFDAYKKAQQDMDYAEFCRDCPQAYAYASLMLSILVNIDGYEVPSEYLIDKDDDVILTGEDIQEVFAFESTPKGKRFSDSLMWKIEEWFVKVQSDLNMIAQAKPEFADEIKDSSTQSLIDETMNAYAMLSDESLKPNYAGPGVLSMGITGYFLLQYIKLFVAISGDKNVMSVLKSVIEDQASRGVLNDRYSSIFSHIQEEDQGELPNLFGNNIFLSIWMPKVDKSISEKMKTISSEPEGTRLHQKTKREIVRLNRAKERALRDFGRWLAPTTDRDRFISEFFSKNKRTSQGIIQTSARKMLNSLRVLSNGQSLDFSNLEAYSREAYKRLFDIESKISDEIYVISNIGPYVSSSDPDYYLRDILIRIFQKRNKYNQDVVNRDLVHPFKKFSSAQDSLYSSRYYTNKLPSKMSIINRITGVTNLETDFVYTLGDNISFYNDFTGNLAVGVVVPDPSAKLERFMNYDTNPGLDRLMDRRNEDVFLLSVGATRQDLESNDELKDACVEWLEDNWRIIGPDLMPINYGAMEISEDELFEMVMPFLFARDKAKIDSLSMYLLLLSRFQIEIKEKMGGGLEDGMIGYFSERLSITNGLFDRAIAEIRQEQQAAQEQVARRLAAAQAAAQQRRLVAAERAERFQLDAQQRRLELQRLKKSQVLNYGLDYSLTPLSITSASDYIVVKELNNSEMLQTYLNIERDSLPVEKVDVYDKIRPIRTLLIEYLEPSTLQSITATTPGKLCVGTGQTSYMTALKRGTQRHYGIVVETAEGLHVAYHGHTERGKLAKSKFTNKWNSPGYPFFRSTSTETKIEESEKHFRNQNILDQAIQIVMKKK